MTNSELRKLDAQIAVEVFGDVLVKVHKLKSGPLVLMRKTRPGEIGIYDRFYLEDGTKLYCGKPFAPEKIEYYSTDIRAAWKVFEKLTPDREMDRWRRTVEQEGEKWLAGILFFSSTEPGVPRWLIVAQADTAPLAICLAALKCVKPK